MSTEYRSPTPHRSPLSEITGIYAMNGATAEATSGVVSASVELFGDGSMWVENYGIPVTLDSDSGTTVNIQSGAANMIRPADQPQIAVSAPMTPPTVWNAPDPGVWTIEPLDQSVIQDDEVSFSFMNSEPDSISWATASLTLDDQHVDFTANSSLYGYIKDPKLLKPGPHKLKLRVESLKGELQVVETVFTTNVLPDSPISSTLEAFDGGVWLTWETIEQSSGYRIWRAETKDSAPSLLNPISLRNQPGFLDTAPLATNHYWVESIDKGGASGERSYMGEIPWFNTAPAAPDVATVTEILVNDTVEGLEIQFNDSAKQTTRWSLSRSTGPTGPFTALEPNEDTISNGFIDQTAQPGITYYYQITPLKLNGTQISSTMSDPIVRASAPVAPRGFIAYNDGTETVFIWSPIKDPRTVGIKLYEDTGSGMIFKANFPSEPNELRIPAVNGVAYYAITSVSATGTESTKSRYVPVGHHKMATNPSRITHDSETVTVNEYEEKAVIHVTRHDNLDEPAIFLHEAHGGTAQMDEDFESFKSYLYFDAGQSQAQYEIPIIADNIDESSWLEDFTTLVKPSLSISDNQFSSAEIQIKDHDVFFFAGYQSWMDVNENAGTMEVSVERVFESGRAVTVEVAIDDPAGSAVEGTHFSGQGPWTVHFAENETVASVHIPLIDNTEKEGSKTLNLKLQNPMPATSISDWFNTQEVTIKDDEYQPGIIYVENSNRPFICEPGVNQLAIPIQRINGTDGDFD